MLYAEVHGPCLDMQMRPVHDCLATMLFHLLPLEGCLPHAWPGAKRLHGNHDSGGTWGRVDWRDGFSLGEQWHWDALALGRN